MSATTPQELVGDDEYHRRLQLVDAIGISEFANAEWSVIVDHVRLMRQNWDAFVSQAAAYHKRLRDELQQLKGDLHDIDEARGMLCGALIIDDPGNTIEVMRQAALAIDRHRRSTETLDRIRKELEPNDPPRAARSPVE